MKVIAISGMASVQDLGRYGHRAQGIGVNGAMDPWALKAGNALLNNAEDTAAIEITLGGLTLAFEPQDVDAVSGEVSVCLTGALYEAYLVDDKNGQRARVPHGWRVAVKAGQRLELVRAVQGMHGYVCVQGGFELTQVLGSLSTNSKAEFGGFEGRFLKPNDTLKVAHTPRPRLTRQGMASFDETLPLTQDVTQAASLDAVVIRVIKNSEYDAFSTTAQQVFEQQVYKLLSSSNRMGYRLEGAQPLDLTEPLQMNSHGVDVGMIQVPPQGQPIVLMADTQTTGGYPKIASVIQADIGKFAQLRFGQSCRFVVVDLDTAMQARQARERYLAKIKQFASAQP